MLRMTIYSRDETGRAASRASLSAHLQRPRAGLHHRVGPTAAAGRGQVHHACQTRRHPRAARFLDEYPKTAPFGILSHGGGEILRLAERVVAAPVPCLRG